MERLEPKNLKKFSSGADKLKGRLDELKKSGLNGQRFWDEFKKLAQELQNIIEKKTEARRIMLEGPLPDVLYHATTEENVQDIIESGGLKIGFSKREADQYRIFLTDSIIYALYVVQQTQEVLPRRIKIFKVKTRGLPRKQFLSMLAFENPNVPGESTHEVVYEGQGIPLDNLELMSDEESVGTFRQELDFLEEQEKNRSNSR